MDAPCNEFWREMLIANIKKYSIKFNWHLDSMAASSLIYIYIYIGAILNKYFENKHKKAFKRLVVEMA